ncbi:MAG: uncharacterized protein K0R25_359 [Rickettsiaceae bacterium]|nr:uncharacterized protein [Rickettsiaceae bacterium]
MTWIAVIGAHKAYFFKRTIATKPTLIEEIEAELDREHEKPGRTFDSMGAGRHAVEPHTDYHQIEKQEFATKILEVLSNGSRHNKFEKLILIADPKMLGIINNHLDKDLASKVQESFPKNFAEMEIREIEEHIADMIDKKLF